jgi:hypothetical protein
MAGMTVTRKFVQGEVSRRMRSLDRQLGDDVRRLRLDAGVSVA